MTNIICKICKEDKKHYAKEKCRSCYQREYWNIPKNKERHRISIRKLSYFKYHTDEEYRKRALLSVSKWREKHLEQCRKYSRESQRRRTVLEKQRTKYLKTIPPKHLIELVENG